MLSAGNDYDSIHAIELLEKIVINDSNILADRAYRAKAIRDYISEQGASYVIPPQRNVSEPWPGGYIQGVIWLSASSKNSNGFAGLPPGMTSWILLFSLLFTWHPSLFC